MSRTTRERLLGQLIAEMREEHFEALKDHRIGWARWILARGYLRLTLMIVALMGSTVLKWAFGISRLAFGSDR